jgi:hypothetical protein
MRHPFRAMVVIALVFVCLVGVAIHSSNPEEVSYHGKSLSQWLEQLDDHAAGNGVMWSPLPRKTPGQIEAADAIRALGTNAIPGLMHDLAVNDSRYFEFLQEAQQYIREKILRKPRGTFSQSVTPAQKIRWKAALAMDALGSAAQSTIPQLASMAIKTSSSSSCKEASFILAGMGPPGIAALTNYSLSPNSWQHICAIWAIGQHPQSSANLVPWLLDFATNRPSGAAGGYPGEIWALGEIHADAARVVPMLIEELSNTNGSLPYWEQSAAVEALGHYGKEASPAVPALEGMKADPQLRWAAEEALKKINSDSQ